MTGNDILNEDDNVILKKGNNSGNKLEKRITPKEYRDSNKSGESKKSNLTKWKNEPSVMELKKDLLASKPYRDQHVKDVKKWELLLKGGKPIPKRRGRSQVKPKLVRRQAEWRYSALSEPFLSSQNIFQVNPRTFEDTDAAMQNGILLNWQLRTKIDIVRLINEAVRTFVDEGTLILRTGWMRETQKVKVKAPIYEYTQVNQGDPEEAQLEQALEIRATNPAEYEKLPDEIKASIEFSEENGLTAWATQIGEEEVVEDKVIVNHPTLEVVDYRNMYLDPSCGNDPEKATFMIASFETSRAELKKDGRYKNLDKLSNLAGDLLTDTDHGTETPPEFNFEDQYRKKIVAYEYWGMYDIHGNGMLEPIVATWIENQCIRMELNPFPDKKPPFLFQSYSPKKRSVFGEPDAELLEDNQAITGAIVRGMIDLLGRSANSQQGFQKGMLDITNRRRFENGDDYEFNPSANPNTALIQHTFPEIPASALNLLGIQNNEAEGLTGVKSFSGGISGESFGNVAAGIKGVVDAAAKREIDILRRLAECFKKASKKIVAMNGVFLSEKEVVRVTNKQFIEIRRDDLTGEFDLEIDISTPEIDERKAADLSFMLQTAAPALPFEFTQMILYEIASLRKMPKLAHDIKHFEPTPDPLEQAKQEHEIKKLELENAKIDAQIKEIYAKTEKLTAEADSIDLDTEMKGTGVSHAQDLEKQSEQARGNQDLAVTKALTQPSKETGDFDLEQAVGFNELTKNAAKTPVTPRLPEQESDLLSGRPPVDVSANPAFAPPEETALDPDTLPPQEVPLT